MPPRFRESLEDGVILTHGAPDRCVRCFSTESFEQQAGLYTSEPGIHRDGRIMRRQFFARAFPAELDRQGRVLVPSQLRRFANLVRRVPVPVACRVVHLNAEPAVLATLPSAGHAPFASVHVETREGRIVAMRVVRDPAKLAPLQEVLQ